MSTATIEVRCNARPTRLAFVVPRPDRDLLLSVIARATSLWGGVFNPIVILDGSTREVRGRQEQITSPAQYLEGQTDILKGGRPKERGAGGSDLLCGPHRCAGSVRLCNPWREIYRTRSSHKPVSRQLPFADQPGTTLFVDTRAFVRTDPTPQVGSPALLRAATHFSVHPLARTARRA